MNFSFTLSFLLQPYSITKMIFTSALAIKEKFGFTSDICSVRYLCKVLMIYGIVIYLVVILVLYYQDCTALEFSPINSKAHDLLSDSIISNDHPTNLSHVLFALFGSEKAWHERKLYIESWWRPNVTRGYIYLDKAPTVNLLPWSLTSPPYRVSDDLTNLLVETKHLVKVAVRIVHGILEALRDENEELRWLVIGDDDSVFFVNNLVDVLSQYDHTKYYYIGGQSEFILSNYFLSFDQGFGGGGFILSYPLAKSLTKVMRNCLGRYAHLKFSDQITMKCIADIGVNLSPHKGIHQIDLRGDISGFLSSHPQAPLISLHHFNEVNPIFPSKDRYESLHHLMKAAKFDESRMLQQTICHHRQSNWSFSTSFGYSVHIYEKIMPRSWLQLPVETFKKWLRHRHPPHYMFNTRRASDDPCEAPHVFFLESVGKTPSNEILTVYSRASRKRRSACLFNGSFTADYITRIEVFSPSSKLIQNGRCECCDIDHVAGMKTAKVKFRECKIDEIIA